MAGAKRGIFGWIERGCSSLILPGMQEPGDGGHEAGGDGQPLGAGLEALVGLQAFDEGAAWAAEPAAGGIGKRNGFPHQRIEPGGAVERGVHGIALQRRVRLAKSRTCRGLNILCGAPDYDCRSCRTGLRRSSCHIGRGRRPSRFERIWTMRTFDISPLLRSSIGFENLNCLVEFAGRVDGADSAYPPYNIEKVGDGEYRIQMAVAGFGRDELELIVQENTLIVTGQANAEAETGDRQFLHRGIAKRAFERRFQLADTIKVTGADYQNGLLNIALVREIPEHKKPRKVEIAMSEPTIVENRIAAE
jgi:molecular chaperone IbpA